MASEPDVGCLDLAPEGCAGCAARDEKLRALAAQVEHFVSLMEGVELDYRLHGHLADLHVVASMLLPASPKESRRHGP